MVQQDLVLIWFVGSASVASFIALFTYSLGLKF